MMAMQISANGRSGNARRFHSTPAKPESAAALRMRLRAPATDDRVKGDEGDQEAGHRHADAGQSARVEYRFAGLWKRHSPYVGPASEASNG